MSVQHTRSAPAAGLCASPSSTAGGQYVRHGKTGAKGLTWIFWALQLQNDVGNIDTTMCSHHLTFTMTPCAFGSFHQRPRAVLAFVALSGIARMLPSLTQLNFTLWGWCALNHIRCRIGWINYVQWICKRGARQTLWQTKMRKNSSCNILYHDHKVEVANCIQLKCLLQVSVCYKGSFHWLFKSGIATIIEAVTATKTKTAYMLSVVNWCRIDETSAFYIGATSCWMVWSMWCGFIAWIFRYTCRWRMGTHRSV